MSQCSNYQMYQTFIFEFWSLRVGVSLDIGNCNLRFSKSPYSYAPCPLLFWAPAGLHADATDIMAEMEGFGKAS
jgi:hypothetical protein